MNFGFLLYPGVTALDLVGPFEVLSRVPNCRVCFPAFRTGPTPTQRGLELVADVDLASCPQLDLLCVPGGPGQGDCMQHRPLLEFLANQARGATWISEVCTGSLILGAAGLLQGYRATTHWRYVDCLADLGAIPVRKRVVVDRNRVTAAGVSAGIDLGLFLAGLLAGERTAQTIQLQLEYDPQPPFRCGSVDSADPDVLQALEAATEASFLERRDQIRRVGALLRGATAP